MSADEHKDLVDILCGVWESPETIATKIMGYYAEKAKPAKQDPKPGDNFRATTQVGPYWITVWDSTIGPGFYYRMETHDRSGGVASEFESIVYTTLEDALQEGSDHAEGLCCE